jgi:formylglycine-generating enzyme required for sulfatase activity
MADIFISFKTDDTPRVQAVHDGFRARGLTVFWSNDILAGAPNYQAIIIDEILKAPVVVVIWTKASVQSSPVIQECSQAQKAGKLFQVLLDDFDPIYMPMPIGYMAQKTMLLDWAGDTSHPAWIKLNVAIDVRIGRRPGAIPVEVGLHGRSQQRYFLPGAGKSEWFKDHEHGPEMVVVPAGCFMMGSLEGERGRSDHIIMKLNRNWGGEVPRHSVEIDKPFAVSRHAITRGQFAAIMRIFINYDPLASRNPGFAQDENHPIVRVDWGEANLFASLLAHVTGKSYRLLTEAEWEFVTRAVTSTTAPHPPFWWGDTITTDQANYDGDYTYTGGGSKGLSRRATVPVDSFAANPWGLFNVHGNVWEWVEDIWHQTYDGAPADGKAWIEGGDAHTHVLRGGSCKVTPQMLRAASRYGMPNGHQDDIGFRVARTLTT